VFVKEFSSSSPALASDFMQTTLLNAKVPVTLFTAGAGKDRESDTLPGVYVYVQGAFLVVNWRSFYNLPNVKPVRIRMSSPIAQSMLTRQVNPAVPSRVHRQDLRGTVTLRIIIDRDGIVGQVQDMSGPPDLVNAATEAVRQWRFKPTLINGDPVEVDTIVTVTFAIGG
jgi:TonB family protein